MSRPREAPTNNRGFAFSVFDGYSFLQSHSRLPASWAFRIFHIVDFE